MENKKIKLSNEEIKKLKINTKDKKYILFLDELNRLLNIEIQKGKYEK